MLHDFTYYNPTRIHFGKSALNKLPQELENHGTNVLLLYGKSAIKKIGLYDQVIGLLQAADKKVTELAGVDPNPRYSTVLEGAKLVKDHQIDLILAVGGGSTIDCAKAISVAAYAEGDAWTRFWINGENVTHPIVPVGSILTMTGTASEMNSGSVITHTDKKLKVGRVFPSFVNPVFSILNPKYTYSVPKTQMVSGIFDIFSHLLEQYFSGNDDNTTDYVIEGILRSLIVSSRKALINPEDYEARSNIMWCSTLALNKIAGVSKTQDWEVHMIEHQIGAYTDCPHGLGLAVVSTAYYKYIYQEGLDKFVRFATQVWNIDPSGKSKEEIALAGIDALIDFIKELGIPTTLRQLGVTEEMLPLIAASTFPGGGYKKLHQEDILNVLKACY